MTRHKLLHSLKMAASLALGFAGLALADPDEAWLVRAALPAGTRPLLVIVLDTSTAMGARVMITEPYDPLKDYAASAGATPGCDPRRVYWRRGPGPAPDCATMTGLPIEGTTALGGMQCHSAREALARHGYFVSARAAQWNPVARRWGALRRDSADTVECRNDRGQHGRVSGPWFAADGPSGPWSEIPAREIDWERAPHGDPYILYTGNFLNYLAATGRTRESTVAQAASEMISTASDATDELDFALMRTSDREPDPDGGFVALAPVPAAQAAAQLPAMLAGFSQSGSAALAETMTEVAAWLSGGAVRFGEDPRADAAALDPENLTRYQSLFTCPCRPITVALVTAGTTSRDDGAAAVAGNWPGFAELTGGCNTNCLPAIARWLAQSDLSPVLPGRQFASLAWLTTSPAPSVIAESLNHAGGNTEPVGDPLAFANIVARTLQHDSAVAANAQVSAAGLLAARDSTHEPAVLYGLSAPQPRQRWLGNLLRYGLQAPASPLVAPIVIGRDGEPVFDPETDLPRPESQSAWSDRPDGAALLSGGAAGQLPVAGSRRLFSDISSEALTSANNRLTPGNRSLSRGLLGLGPHDQETPDIVISWLLDQRQLGDPGLRAPASVGDASTGNRTTFLATHDGLLHAFDTETGVERWAFIPRQLLPRLRELMRNEATVVRSHGIDGALVLHRHDANGDGRIDPSAGEHLWLIFGLGRGGSGYYALDIAAPDEPRLMWSLGSAALGGAAESWAEPVISRLTIDGVRQAAGSWVVLLAGGYDRAYDSAGPVAGSTGASLSVLDAETGGLLWRAAGSASLLPNLLATGMAASLASAPRVLDLDGDGFVDRVYAIDVEGGLWRMDLQNGAAAAGLARARMVARLGGDGQRFYSSPDVSMIRESAGLQAVISVGSGWLARPRDKSIIDRVYSIRDQGPAGSTLRESALHDATAGLAMPAGAPGWFVRLDSHAGEKVIGSALTFDHRLHFLTYQPDTAPPSAVCGPPQAVRRLRIFDVRTGLPSTRVKFSGDPDELELPGSGLPSALRFAFPGPWEGACPDCRPRSFGLAGPETFDAGFSNDPVKTSWRKLAIEPDSR